MGVEYLVVLILKAVRPDYPDQTRIRIIATGRAGTIISNATSQLSIKMYSILLDGDTREILFDCDSIAPEDHPIHKQMEKWRAEGLARGFTSIVIGTTDRAYKAFFCNDPKGYASIVRRNSEIKFKYYWRLTA